MTQKTQFLMVKGSDAMNVQPESLATYQAAGWSIVDLKYSEGGEGLDVTSQVLMVKDSDAVHVRPGAVASYQAQGYRAVKIVYGAAATVVSTATGAHLTFLDTPAFASAEIGTVNETTVAVTFSTEV